MTSLEKINQLREKLYYTLQPLIGERCVLLGLPYYFNIGDILIWEGTRQFINDIGTKCTYLNSKETFRFPALDQTVTILLQGGGNFGDLWRSEQDFRLSVIENYPNNKIIVLPQTVYYQNVDNARLDSEKCRLHKNLFICARDSKSYSFLSEYFTNEILLLPDMAFCMSSSIINNYRNRAKEIALFVKRNDMELVERNYDSSIHTDLSLEVSDWPTLQNDDYSIILKVFCHLLRYSRYYRVLVDWYADNIFRPYMLKTGIQFVSSYSEIYTTRLHVAILSLLLDKSFVFFNNSYGKNLSFYESWLKDLKTIQFVKL